MNKKQIMDLDLLYLKESKEAKKINEELSTFYSVEELALIKEHKDQYPWAKKTNDLLVERLNILEEQLSSFSKDPKFDVFNNPILTTKKNHLYNVCSMRAAMVASDEYVIKFEPAREKDIEAARVFGLIFNEWTEKIDLSYHINSAIARSRFSTHAIDLILFKTPQEAGFEDDSSYNFLEITQLNPKNVMQDPSAIEIEQARFVYDISKTTWSEIVNSKVLGKNKQLLEYLQDKVSESVVKEKSTAFNSEFSTARDENVRNEKNIANILGINLLRRWYIKNKGKSNQECWVAYFIGEDILLNHHKVRNQHIPMAVYKEYNEPQSFYGSSKAIQLVSHSAVINALSRQIDQKAIQGVSSILVANGSTGITAEEIKIAMSNPNENFIIIDADEQTQIHNVINTVDLSGINQNAIIMYNNLVEEFYKQGGINQQMVGDLQSQQTQSAIARANSQATIEIKSTLPNIEKAVKRTAAIIANYIQTNTETIKKYYTKQIKKINLDPATQSSRPFEFEAVDFDKIKEKHVDLIPKVKAIPKMDRAEITNQVNMLLSLSAQGDIGVPISYLLKEIFKQMPWIDDALMKIEQKNKENVADMISPIADNVANYTMADEDQRTPQQVLDEQTQFAYDTLNSPANSSVPSQESAMNNPMAQMDNKMPIG